MSKSDTKELRCRQTVKQNVGIMRFLLAGSVPFWAFVSDLDIVGRSAPEGGRATLLRRNSAAARDSTEGWDAPASHPSVSAQSRMTGSSRVQFFERRARSSRYPPTTAIPARPRISSALVPVRDSLLPAFAACVGAALGALAPPVGCAMVPSDGRSISSGSMPGFGVAAALRLGAGLALDDGFPGSVAAAVAFGFTTDGARPVAPGLGAELGCAPGACVGSAEGATVWACVGSAAGAEDVSGAGAAVGPSVCSGAELGAGAGVGSVLGAVVGSGAGALLGSGAALGSDAEDGAGACVGSALGAADGAGFSVGAAEGAAVGDGAGLGSAGFWPHCSPSQFIVKLRYQMPP